jgi:hypothetical protein
LKQPFEETERRLDELQTSAFRYFLEGANRANGLVLDCTKKDWPSSIAAVGLALSVYPVGVERGWIPREEAAGRCLTALRFFAGSDQSGGPDATGYKGFYYHFLDMQTGRRHWRSELSTVDSAFLFGGMLVAAAYFDRDSDEEREIRDLATKLYRRADWVWATNGGATVTLGWTPEDGFLSDRWEGYDESLLLYALGLGSPTYPLPEESYRARTVKCQWREIYGTEYLHAGPLFTHQYSHMWIDFRGIQDAFMREHGIDYFENSRRATHVQREYAIRNPNEFEGYGDVCWGLTACEGPGPATLRIGGRERTFYDYVARGVPDGPDDGTIAPWAVVASLPFAPEIVLPALAYFEEAEIGRHAYGLEATFNPTFPSESERDWGWLSPWHFGINEGPIVLMIENHRSELLWGWMRKCPFLVEGLRRAGFRGGWL